MNLNPIAGAAGIVAVVFAVCYYYAYTRQTEKTRSLQIVKELEDKLPYKVIHLFCLKAGLGYEFYGPGQYRINSSNFKIDICTLSGSYHDYYNNIKGKYEDLETFLNSLEWE